MPLYLQFCRYQVKNLILLEISVFFKQTKVGFIKLEALITVLLPPSFISEDTGRISVKFGTEHLYCKLSDGFNSRPYQFNLTPTA
jgi:hypothetical protein